MGAILSPFPLLERCSSADAMELWAQSRAEAMISRASSAPATFDENSNGFHCNCDSANSDRRIQVVNWNVAAPNNNPFEYWAMHDDERYNELMTAVQHCIDEPGKHDVEIGLIFTQEMFLELKAELEKQGTSHLDQLQHVWTTDLMKRKSIAEFLKDRSFGEKRLISMPDRMTSSVKTESGQEIFRPSPMTGIKDDIGDIPTWWALWRKFMFRIQPCMRGKPITNVFSMLEIIPRAKYPALSEAEEALSLPLQTLCLALFDAVFIHLLSCVARDAWQPLKRSLHEALFENKAMSCVSILQSHYCQADVIFVQEASESFAAKAGVCLDHFVLRPQGVDGRRLQMSLILARRSAFLHASAREVTDELLDSLRPARCVEKGDLCVFEVLSRDGPCLLASFHGDSNGKSTAPVLAALDALARGRYPGHTLLFGLDGNTVSGAANAASPLSVAGFNTLLAGRGLASCWGGQELEGVWTTFNARTYLQPQLQKAVGLSEVLDRRHMQLKDWILFYDAQLAADAVGRDNTGRGEFVAAVMPSRRFPSDHAIVAAHLRRRRPSLPPPPGEGAAVCNGYAGAA